MQTTKPETAQQRPTGARMALLMLLYFIKIGAFTFGSGWSIIAQMEREFVDERGWMTKSDLLELIAVGKSLPGIMVANITLLFGYQMAGALGGICAAISLGKDALTSAMPIIICAVAFVLCYFTSISNLTLVAAGVVIALVWMGVSEHGHV